MRKILVLGIAVLAFGAFLAVPGTALACDGDKTTQAKEAAHGKLVSSKTGCTPEEIAKCAAKLGISVEECKQRLASGKAHCSRVCTPEEMAKCAEKLGISPEECQKMCASGDMSHINMSIRGMTTGGCEEAVTASLQGVPGVVRVHAVSYKSGEATLCISKDVQEKALLRAVSNKGFQAEIIPAVATLTTDAPAKTATAGCSKKMSGKSCGAKKAAAAKASAESTDGSQ
jgi:copper chaperone CopZ